MKTATLLSTDLLALFRGLSQQLLTVVDVETTGSQAYKSRVMEIAVVQASLADGILHQQAHLINPHRQIPRRITEVTGITQAMVQDAPGAAEIWPDYWPYLGSGVLTAHNLEFDYSFLRMESTRLGLALVRPDAEQLCTVQLSRLMLPDLPSRSLPNLVRHFGFNVGPSHRAEADAVACWLLAQRLLTELLNEGDEVLLARFAQQWLPLKYAVKLLGCSPKLGRSRLETAGVEPRQVVRGENTVFLYRRGDVERVALQPCDTQLSWL